MCKFERIFSLSLTHVSKRHDSTLSSIHFHLLTKKKIKTQKIHYLFTQQQQQKNKQCLNMRNVIGIA